MLILAFDTSGFSGSVAVLEADRVLWEAPLAANQRSAQSLAPAIVEVLTSAGVAPTQVRLVAATVGPGSFTGLRVGVTAAKTFAYAVGAQVLGISTLEAIAYQVSVQSLPEPVHEVQAILDAQRNELFVGRFEVDRQRTDFLSHLRRKAPDRLETIKTWLAGLDSRVAVTGGGLRRLQDRVAKSNVADAALWQPAASTVGKLAWRDYQHGRRDDLWKISPVYLRLSYAEEKAMPPS